VRLIAQGCAALLVVFASGIAIKSLGAPLFFDLHLGLVAIPFTVLFIITLINAFNIIDGIDGLAGGLALLSLAALAIIGVHTDVFALAVILLAVVAAFLLFNAPFEFNRPVRTFMGDAGSTFLGLSIAAVGIWLSQGPVPRMSPVVGLWLVAVPVFDLFSTIVRRLMSGRSPFAPDHEHLHHVLTENGLSRRSTLGWMLFLAALCASAGIIGDMLAVPDGVLLLAWFMGGALYYQMLRKPRLVVGLVEGVRGGGRAKSETT
jgi:UDP-GlcNAc:undecaprenyl-phosphate GlcNAc-1-phosphate transferase